MECPYRPISNIIVGTFFRTFFPELGSVIKLERGEFLIHPGSLVHCGMNLTGGTRYLMVLFAHLSKDV